MPALCVGGVTQAVSIKRSAARSHGAHRRRVFQVAALGEHGLVEQHLGEIVELSAAIQALDSACSGLISSVGLETGAA